MTEFLCVDATDGRQCSTAQCIDDFDQILARVVPPYADTPCLLVAFAFVDHLEQFECIAVFEPSESFGDRFGASDAERIGRQIERSVLIRCFESAFRWQEEDVPEEQ